MHPNLYVPCPGRLEKTAADGAITCFRFVPDPQTRTWYLLCTDETEPVLGGDLQHEVTFEEYWCKRAALYRLEEVAAVRSHRQQLTTLYVDGIRTPLNDTLRRHLSLT